MRSLLPFAAWALAVGCAPPQDNISGSAIDMTDYFIYSSSAIQTWEFINRDPSITYQLIANQSEAVEETPDGQIFSVAWNLHCVSADPECVDRTLKTVKWRVEQSRGVFLPGIVPAQGLPIDFAPEVQLALGEMDPGEFVVSNSGGFTFTATFDGFADCPVSWTGTSDWGDDCIQITLDDGDTNPATNPEIVGTYWAIVGFDVVAWQGEEDLDVWQLSKYECVGDC